MPARVRRNRRTPIADIANPRIPTVRVEESPGGAIVTTEVVPIGVGVKDSIGKGVIGPPTPGVDKGVGERAGVKRGFRVGVGEGPPTGGGVGVRVGAIARVLVGVGVGEGKGVGVFGVGVGFFGNAKVGVAEGVADWLTWVPWAKTVNDCVMVLSIPKTSLVIIVIVCWPGERGLLGRYFQFPNASAVTSASKSSGEWIIIFIVLLGIAVPLNCGCWSENS